MFSGSAIVEVSMTEQKLVYLMEDALGDLDGQAPTHTEVVDYIKKWLLKKG